MARKVKLSRTHFRDIDRGFKRIVKAMGKAASKPKAHVVVGFPETAHQNALGQSVADIAAVHEYGSSDGRVPQRSMIAATVDAHLPKYKKAVRAHADNIGLGKIKLRDALEKFGALVLRDVQKRIDAGIPPPLSPATIRRKGSSKILVETGQMRQALNYETRDV